jgi:NADH-quinone oxidoreductase subunit J
MMLDIKYSNFTKKDYYLFLLLLFLSPFFFIFIYNSSLLSFFNKTIKNSELFFYNFDSFNNIDIFGQCLYNYYIPIFLIAGFVLLVAMLGAIILTLKFNLQKRKEFVHKKLSRTSTFLSFFN